MKNACTCSNYSGWLLAMRGALLAQGVCGGTFWPLFPPSLRRGVVGSLSACAVYWSTRAAAGARARGGVAGATPCSSCVYTPTAAAALKCVYSNVGKVLHGYKNKSAGHGARPRRVCRGRGCINWLVNFLVLFGKLYVSWNFSKPIQRVLCAVAVKMSTPLTLLRNRCFQSARVCGTKICSPRVKVNWVRALLPFVYVVSIYWSGKWFWLCWQSW